MKRRGFITSLATFSVGTCVAGGQALCEILPTVEPALDVLNTITAKNIMPAIMDDVFRKSPMVSWMREQ